MTQADLITLVVLALVVAGILLYLRKQKKTGGAAAGAAAAPTQGPAIQKTKNSKPGREGIGPPFLGPGPGKIQVKLGKSPGSWLSTHLQRDIVKARKQRSKTL